MRMPKYRKSRRVYCWDGSINLVDGWYEKIIYDFPEGVVVNQVYKGGTGAIALLKRNIKGEKG